MLSLDFNKKFKKESNRIALLLTIIAIVCLIIGLLFPKLISNNSDKMKNNNDARASDSLPRRINK